MQHVGARVRRKEDPRLLRGLGTYVGDIQRVGMLHAAVVRSPYGHALVQEIDTADAARLPGVAAVLTAADLAHVGLIPLPPSPLAGLDRARQSVLARDVVRYVGEPVAVVVADSRYEAEDAAEHIQVRYEPLEAVVDARRAVEPGAPVLHPAVPDNVANRFITETGDVAQCFATAPFRLEETFAIQRHTGVPMETRGLLAEFDLRRNVLTMWGPTKIVHTNRATLAGLLGIPESQIRFIETDVGGGFGVRGEFYPEDFLVPFLARRLGRPVCWIEDRAEHLKAAQHSREQWHHVTVAYDEQGRLLAMDDRCLVDIGAYAHPRGAVAPSSTSVAVRGPYDFQHYRSEVASVLTNKAPAAVYRGPGRFEATFVCERVIDLIAHRLGLDPAEVRRRNLVQPEQMPYDLGETIQGRLVLDSGDYPRQLERVLERVDYPRLRAACAEQRRDGRAVGVGLAFVLDKSSQNPWEYGRVEVDLAGHVTAFSGGASLGQGMETAFAQIVADELAVPFDRVTVVHGDTDLVPYGIGSFAGRGTATGGNALALAAQQVKVKLLRRAAQLLEVSPDDLRLQDSAISVQGAENRRLTLAEVARSLVPLLALKDGIEPGLVESAFFRPDHAAVYPYGVHLAVVEVDRATGSLDVQRYVAMHDVGRMVNPMLVEGQLTGGIAQGIGGAMLEEMAYSPEGQLLSGSFMDYLLPTAATTPSIDLVVTEDALSPWNPLGVKGAGEGGIIGGGAALANAVCDALGTEVFRLPLTPTYIRSLIAAI